MKRNLKILTISAFLIIAPLLIFAQNPPHPGGDPTPGGGGSGTPVGAPVGSGTFILITLAAAYAIRKIYVMRTTAQTAEE